MWFSVALLFTLFFSGSFGLNVLGTNLSSRAGSSIDLNIIPSVCTNDCHAILMNVYGCGASDSTCMCSATHATLMETCLSCYETSAADDTQGKRLADTYEQCVEDSSAFGLHVNILSLSTATVLSAVLLLGTVYL